MRTKKATKHNSQDQHNQFGVYNWFRLKGISSKEVIQETVHNFCQESGFCMDGFSFSKKEKEIFNWVAGRFQAFAAYSGKFLQENNYTPSSHSKTK